jgi:hypothetical protein
MLARILNTYNSLQSRKQGDYLGNEKAVRMALDKILMTYVKQKDYVSVST